MSAIVARMNNPFSGFLAYLAGATVTLTELIRNGSVWVIFGGLIISALGGFWTYRSARMKFKIDMINLKIAELELEKAAGLQNGEPIKKRHHHR